MSKRQQAWTGNGMFAPEREAMPRADLTALQLVRLHKTLTRAYAQVPHFKTAFDGAGVTPDSLKSLDDLVRFPFTVKNDLRDNYPWGLFAVPRDEMVRVHASSGTTGKPTVVGYTRHDLAVWSHLMARAQAAAGVGPGDVLHNALGYGLFTGGLGFHDGGQTLGGVVVPISGGNTERQVMLLEDLGATALFSTPSYALNIAETAERLGVDLQSGPLRVAILGAEPSTSAMQDEVGQRLGLVPLDHYGLSEILGPGVAAQCLEGRNGCHAWEDHFIFEIIDPESEQRLAPGEKGELVITTLTKQALPMVRYRTRDITTLLDEPCPCGRSHVRIDRIAGRSDDMLIIRGVNVYPSQIEAFLVGLPDIEPHYQLVVRREGALDTLAVEVEARPGVGADEYPRLAQAAGHQIKTMVGVTCHVEVLEPGGLPRSEGKAVRVRDLRIGK
ncbi:MAG TPA: phenylacetate--CoA ligase [Alphaproteobacteria bacterium]|jgi:phenylacetate-CoA ligase|nr:phenylacetate--CoA ligase [Alphaproteobacteria bacterium]MDP6269389.1 phenylacetate--CoA ligase [Alphaproteobacteria bacterium]HJM50742.1 phenylacetate--CoA ligase [Alphaproteobacteria bacterium]